MNDMGNLPDINQMGTLLQKMTADTSGEIQFTDSQVIAVMEILIPKLVTTMPGMPHGMYCQVDRSPKGWTITVERPS